MEKRCEGVGRNAYFGVGVYHLRICVILLNDILYLLILHLTGNAFPISILYAIWSHLSPSMTECLTEEYRYLTFETPYHALSSQTPYMLQAMHNRVMVMKVFGKILRPPAAPG